MPNARVAVAANIGVTLNKISSLNVVPTTKEAISPVGPCITIHTIHAPKIPKGTQIILNSPPHENTLQHSAHGAGEGDYDPDNESRADHDK